VIGRRNGLLQENVFLPLMGGLGNQLFQIHAALGLNPRELILDPSFFIEHTKPIRYPDSLHFKWPKEVNVAERKRKSFFTRRLANLIVRISSSGLSRDLKGLLIAPFYFVTSLLFSMRYRKLVTVYVPLDVGYSKPMFPITKNIVALGYFQSYMWFNHLPDKDLVLSKNEENFSLEYFKSASRIELPLIVHIRLTDFVSSKDRLPVQEQYLRKHLGVVFSSTNSKMIWLFSDDIEKALALIPNTLRNFVRVVDNPKYTTAQLLQIMRCGHAFFISNSTLSWWAAFKAFNRRSEIYCPSMWLKNDPVDLIPSSWNLLS